MQVIQYKGGKCYSTLYVENLGSENFYSDLQILEAIMMSHKVCFFLFCPLVQNHSILVSD